MQRGSKLSKAQSVRHLKYDAYNPEYVLAKTVPPKENVLTFFSKKSKVNCFTEHAHHKRGVPAPNKYQRPLSWKAVNKNNDRQKFLQEKRITETDKILATRKLRLPGPG